MADNYVDEVGALDPLFKTVKQTRQGYQPVYNPMNYPYPGEKGGFNIGQVFSVALAVASLAVPGIGQTIGSAILGAAGITGVSVAVKVGVGMAALSAASTAAAGGSVEDVLKNAASAGIASGINIGLGGGVTGAAAGSVAGTAIKGGNADQVLTNALAAGVGAGVQDVLPDNPDAGKIIGSAARSYISTGGNIDQTLLNTTITAIGTLDQPSKTNQQPTNTSSRSGSTLTRTIAPESQPSSPTVSETPIKLGDTYYYPMSNGGAAYTDDKGVSRYISAAEFEADKSTFGVSEPTTAVPRDDVATTTLDPQTIIGTKPDASPIVTDLDLVNEVAGQQPPAVDSRELERVIVQGRRESNVAPVVTELDPVTIIGQRDPVYELDRVTITGKQDPDVDTLDTSKVEEEKPEDSKEEPKNFYPVVTGVSRTGKPRAPSIITGGSSARLLADALAAYRPAGAIEGQESGKQKQNVWNEKSLRLKDALGL